MGNENLLVEMRGIHKSFGSLRALIGIDFSVKKNEIVGLVGDNGAGKSTLIKILCGIHQPDKGEIYFEGKEVRWASPREARLSGIETVHQDLALVPLMGISRNFFLGREPRRAPLGIFIDKQRMDKEAIQRISEFGVLLSDSDQMVATLSGGQRQCVAITRAIHFGAKLLILDEPVAALSIQETRKVLETVEQTKERGISVIFISHNIRHVYSIADRFVILFRGMKVGDIPKEETTIDDVEEMIISGQPR